MQSTLPTASPTPTFSTQVALLKRELKLRDGTAIEILHEAAEQLGINHADKSLIQLANTCVNTIWGAGEPEEIQRVEVQPNPSSSDRSCVVCLTESVNHMIRPCNHACVCAACAPRLDSCPICRNRIASVERVWIT